MTNFKAIGLDGVRLELAPLTLLVGPNASGKSSVLEAIGLLAQSVRPIGRTGLNLDAPLVSLGADPRALYHAKGSEHAIEISTTWKLADHPEPIRYWFSVSRAEDWASSVWQQGLQVAGDQIIFMREQISPEGAYRQVARLEGSSHGSILVNGSLSTLLDPGLFIPAGNTGALAPQFDSWRLLAGALATTFQSPRIRYLSPIRGGPLISSLAQGPAASSAGRYGEDTVRLLSNIAVHGNARMEERLNTLAKRFGVPQLRAGWGGQAKLDATFQDPSSGARLDIAFAGFGSQQALPIITDLVHAEPGTVLMVEELEHSSHPEWITKWGETLAETAAIGDLQVLATTHAPDVVLALASAVRKNLVSADKIAIYEFTRDMDRVHVERARIGGDGVLEGGWLRTFARAENALVEALIGEEEAGNASTGEVRSAPAGRSNRTRRKHTR